MINTTRLNSVLESPKRSTWSLEYPWIYVGPPLYIYMPARSYSDACYWLTTDRSRAVYVVVARETCNNIYRSNSNSNHAAYTLYCTVVVNVAFYHGYVHSTVTSTFLCQQYASTRPALSSISAVCCCSRFLRGDRSDRIGSDPPAAGRQAWAWPTHGNVVHGVLRSRVWLSHCTASSSPAETEYTGWPRLRFENTCLLLLLRRLDR
jgi:hypothetical protein